jgi:hypothetical protein
LHSRLYQNPGHHASHRHVMLPGVARGFVTRASQIPGETCGARPAHVSERTQAPATHVHPGIRIRDHPRRCGPAAADGVLAALLDTGQPGKQPLACRAAAGGQEPAERAGIPPVTSSARRGPRACQVSRSRPRDHFSRAGPLRHGPQHAQPEPKVQTPASAGASRKA